MNDIASFESNRNEIMKENIVGLRACCFNTAFCIESSNLIHILFKIILGLFIEFHLFLSFFLSYQKVFFHAMCTQNKDF